MEHNKKIAEELKSTTQKLQATTAAYEEVQALARTLEDEFSVFKQINIEQQSADQSKI